MHEQTSTPEMPGEGLQGTREESKLLLPVEFGQKAGRQTFPLQHSSPLPRSTVVQALTQERNQPLGEGLSHGTVHKAVVAVLEQSLGPAQGGDGRDVAERGGPLTLVCKGAWLPVRWRWVGACRLLSPRGDA